MITTALIDTRVSSDEQAREGLSLDAQHAACRHHAAREPGRVTARSRSQPSSTSRPSFVVHDALAHGRRHERLVHLAPFENLARRVDDDVHLDDLVREWCR